MKVKSFVAFAFTACAVPAVPALAQNADPAGPQGTGWYGAPNRAVPVPQIVPPYVYERRPLAAAPESNASDWRMRDPVEVRRPARERWVYHGNSFDTNPPVPAP